jgi:hypothetical protein
MKPTLKLLAGILTVLLLLTACTSIFINEISKSPEFNINSENSKTALVVYIDRVFLYEFIRTFNKKYKNNRDFVNDYTKTFANKLEIEKIFAQIKVDTSSQWNLMKTLAVIPGDFTNVGSLFHNCSADYLICLSDFTISNCFKMHEELVIRDPNTPPTPVYVPPSNPYEAPPIIKEEFCVTTARIQIFNVKSRQIELEYLAIGEKKVVLFGFGSALTKSIIRSNDHAVAYLKTGKKEF